MAKTLDLRTYLVLERAFVRRLQRSWRIQSAPTYAAIAKACNEHKWDEARRLVPDLDMAEVGTENREWITYMLLSLAVFGAGTVAKGKPSFVGVGTFDTFLRQVTNNLLMYLEYRATAQVQAEALQAIAEDEAKTKALKFDPQQPRDDHGRWIAVTRIIQTGHSLASRGPQTWFFYGHLGEIGQKAAASKVKMSGKPHHAVEGYLPKQVVGNRWKQYSFAVDTSLVGQFVQKFDESQHPRDTTGKFIEAVHGTAAVSLESILKEGIKVAHSGEVWPDFSHKDSVYVTVDEQSAKVWGAFAAQERRMNVTDPEYPDIAIIKVRIPAERAADLIKDENMVNRDAPARQFKGDIPPEWIVGAQIGTKVAAPAMGVATMLTTPYPSPHYVWKDVPLKKAAADGQIIYVVLVLQSSAKKFDEAQHPRDKAGRFVDAEGVTHVGGFVELYHGTSKLRANKILKEGFKIRAVPKQTMGGDPESSRNYIWLAKQAAYAQRYSEMHLNPTVVTVRLPEALYKKLTPYGRNTGPDSVWVKEAIPAKYVQLGGPPAVEAVEKALGEARDQLSAENGVHVAQMSYSLHEVPITSLKVRERKKAQAPLVQAYRTKPETIPPVSVRREGNKLLVLDGHRRIQSAKAAGKKSMWVVEVHNTTSLQDAEARYPFDPKGHLHYVFKFDESKIHRQPKGSEHGGEFAADQLILQGADSAANRQREVEKHLDKWEKLTGKRPTPEDLKATEEELRALPLVHGTTVAGALGSVDKGLLSHADMEGQTKALKEDIEDLQDHIDNILGEERQGADLGDYPSEDMVNALGLNSHDAKALLGYLQELHDIKHVLQGTTNRADRGVGLDEFVFMTHGEKHQDYGPVAVIIDNKVLDTGFATEKDIVMVPDREGPLSGQDPDRYSKSRIKDYQEMIVKGDDYYAVAAAKSGTPKALMYRSREQLFEVKAPHVPKTDVLGFVVTSDFDAAQRLADGLAGKGLTNKVLYLDENYGGSTEFLNKQLKYMQAIGRWDKGAVERFKEEHEGVYIL